MKFFKKKYIYISEFDTERANIRVLKMKRRFIASTYLIILQWHKSPIERKDWALHYRHLSELELNYLHNNRSDEEWGLKKERRKNPTLIRCLRKPGEWLSSFDFRWKQSSLKNWNLILVPYYRVQIHTTEVVRDHQLRN